MKNLHRRHAIETRAFEAGEQRGRIDNELAVNNQRIMDLMPQALDAGIPLETFAKFVGVSRQTLYRWRDAS